VKRHHGDHRDGSLGWSELTKTKITPPSISPQVHLFYGNTKTRKSQEPQMKWKSFIPIYFTHKLGVEEKRHRDERNHKRILQTFSPSSSSRPIHLITAKDKNTKRNKQTAEQEEAQTFHLSLYIHTEMHTYIIHTYIHTLLTSRYYYVVLLNYMHWFM
jgi:hypothetical protein